MARKFILLTMVIGIVAVFAILATASAAQALTIPVGTLLPKDTGVTAVSTNTVTTHRPHMAYSPDRWAPGQKHEKDIWHLPASLNCQFENAAGGLPITYTPGSSSYHLAGELVGTPEICVKKARSS